MYKNLLFKISLGLLAFLVSLLFFTKVLVEPWLAKKIEAKANEKYCDYQVRIDKVNISFLKSGLTLENLTISSRKKQDGIPELAGEITSIKLSGINFTKILFKKELEINEVRIFHSCIRGKIPFNNKPGPPIIMGFNIRVNRLFFNMIDFSFGNTLSDQTFSVKNGIFMASDLHMAKMDTLSPAIFSQFDFDADELLSLTPDSMYTFKAKRFKYSETTGILSADSFLMHPNYTDYEFCSRRAFQTNRIEAGFKNILVHDFSVSAFIKSNSLVSSRIEIERMSMNAFRDNRKKFRHVNKPSFQDMIYNYPGTINISSISVLNGNVVYTEHAEKANEPGRISFTEVSAQISEISNDTLIKKSDAYLRLDVKTLLMGKGKMAIQLKAKLFDPFNTFYVNGTLSEMEAGELNQMFEKSAFIQIRSGKIDSAKFSFIANDTKATGEMILMYHGLKITLKNKKTEETTAMKEKLGSLIANMIILDSNPLPGNGIRKGTINYVRDPEKFVVNYCSKSILTGIKSSLSLKNN